MPIHFVAARNLVEESCAFDVLIFPALIRGPVGWPMHSSGDQTRQTVLGSCPGSLGNGMFECKGASGASVTIMSSRGENVTFKDTFIHGALTIDDWYIQFPLPRDGSV